MSYVKQINRSDFFVMSQGDTGCCNEAALAICKTEITIDEGSPSTMASITIDGVTYTIDWTFADGLGALASKIATALNLAGYFMNVDDIPGVVIHVDEWNADRILISIYSNAESIDASADNGSVAAPDCIKTVAAKYTFEIEYDDASFTLDDTNLEDPQAVTTNAGAGDADALGSDIWDALVALYSGETNVTEKRVQVIENAAASKFLVNVWLYGRHPLTLDSAIVPFCGSFVDFTTTN